MGKSGIRVYSGNKLPKPGPERDTIKRRVIELKKANLSHHNIAIRLDIPYGSISRIVREYEENQDKEGWWSKNDTEA